MDSMGNYTIYTYMVLDGPLIPKHFKGLLWPCIFTCKHVIVDVSHYTNIFKYCTLLAHLVALC